MATAVEPARVPDTRWDLLIHLRSLDALLKHAVARARLLYGSEATDSSYHGIYISEDEIDSLINRNGESVYPEIAACAMLRGFHHSPPIEALGAKWEFTEFDTAVLLLAVAPEIDLRYERIYAYLQDDVTKRRPTVDLALTLLCDSNDSRLEQRSRFAPEAPLLRSGLLRLGLDAAQGEAPLLAHHLRLDERAINLLLGNEGLDSRLASFCELTSATELDFLDDNGNAIARRLPAFAGIAKNNNRPVRLLFYGPAMASKQHAAQVFAATSKATLLTADMERCPAWRTEPIELSSLLKREASFSNAVLFLKGLSPVATEEIAARAFLNNLTDYAGTIVIASDNALLAAIAGGDRFLTIPFDLPNYEARFELWQEFTNVAGVPLSAELLDSLANNFQLAPEQIESAVRTARQCLEWRITETGTLTISEISEELLAAARNQTGLELAALTEKLKPIYRWSDIVLPDDTIAQLKEICQRVKYSHAVLEQGGFGKKLSAGKGIAVLFAGPSGTGKTMAAEIIANELGLDLFRIDLSSVVSKYIGETEKNLERIFAAAARSNSVLLFDEADALFGKRSAVNDAHDRYANVEISYLLQKMEQYEGITILTSNLRGNIDEGFWRRLAFTVHFPFPETDTRLEIWKRIWPKETAVDADVDFSKLAERFSLSGANIRNIGLAAAFLAATESRPVRMADVLHATRREYTKVGKAVTALELEDTIQ
ncbi:MAG TPA: AAA family ATPase [Pyrinomonadaceae bacterium]|nr:AAA family ATPase [Pyrinomonadaceae bacterium]